MSVLKSPNVKLLEQIFNPHWNYFLALEEDFKNTLRYIELDKQNFKTYSIEYTKIILSSCSEIEIILKEISEHVFGTKNGKDIIGYYKTIITKGHSKKYLIDIVGVFQNPDLKLKPWHRWTSKIRPKWWSNYQNVKHNRHKYYTEANLKNCLYSLSALLLLNVFIDKYYNLMRDISPTFVFYSKKVPQYLTHSD